MGEISSNHGELLRSVCSRDVGTHRSQTIFFLNPLLSEMETNKLKRNKRFTGRVNGCNLLSPDVGEGSGGETMERLPVNHSPVVAAENKKGKCLMGT